VKTIEARIREGKPTDRQMRTLNILVRHLYGLSETGE
jgi:hypothetical protein